MTLTKTIVAALALSALSVASAEASERTLKPMQGLSFHAGTKHAVGYFLSENRSCKLVLTLADDANFRPSRLEMAVAGGQSALYRLADGTDLQFACERAARTMTIKTLDSTAAN